MAAALAHAFGDLLGLGLGKVEAKRDPRLDGVDGHPDPARRYRLARDRRYRCAKRLEHEQALARGDYSAAAQEAIRNGGAEPSLAQQKPGSLRGQWIDARHR